MSRTYLWWTLVPIAFSIPLGLVLVLEDFAFLYAELMSMMLFYGLHVQISRMSRKDEIRLIQDRLKVHTVTGESQTFLTIRYKGDLLLQKWVPTEFKQENVSFLKTETARFLHAVTLAIYDGVFEDTYHFRITRTVRELLNSIYK